MKQISYIKKPERFVHILENLKNYKKCSGKIIISLNNTKFCLKVLKSCFVSFQAMEVLFKKAVIIN